MSTAWYVLRVKPHKEQSVYERLQEREEVEVFYPSIRVKPVNPRSAKIRPYFPGYLFVRADLDELGRNAFRWIPGTQGLVAFGGAPAAVPAALIQELKKRLAQIRNLDDLALDRFKKGERVRIVGGPFAGYEAIFDARLPGKERAQVLLAFLSQQPQPLKLDADDIEKL